MLNQVLTGEVRLPNIPSPPTPARLADNKGRPLNMIINLNVPDAIIMQRINGAYRRGVLRWLRGQY